MKKLILAVVIGLLLIGFNVFAGSGDLIVDGNLGIGTTTSPSTKLEVVGGAAITNTAYAASAGILGRRANGPQLGSETQVLLGNQIFGLGARPWFSDTGVFAPTSLANITMNAAENITSLAKGTYITFGTTAIGNNGIGERMRIDQNGYVGIGTPNPSSQLTVNGVVSAISFVATSDARLKTNIQPYSKGLKELLQVNPVSYNYNGKGGIGHHTVTTTDPVTGNDVDTDVVDTKLLATTFVGVMAQDIQSVVPEAVFSHKGRIDKSDTVKTDILDFNPHTLTFILINAIKDLKSQIDSLNQQIAVLQAMVK